MYKALHGPGKQVRLHVQGPQGVFFMCKASHGPGQQASFHV